MKKDENIPNKNNAGDNALAPLIPGEKNSSDMWTKGINKNNNLPKKIKTNKNVKITKNSYNNAKNYFLFRRFAL